MSLDNPSYSADEYGTLFTKDKTVLIRYPAGSTRTAYAVPNSVTNIGDYAFGDCRSLTSATIGSGVTSIGSCVFNYSDSLTSVKFEDGSNWYRVSDETDWQNQTNGILTDLSKSKTNATYFKSTYYRYYWYKKV